MKLTKSLIKVIAMMYAGGAIATGGISYMFCYSGAGAPDWATILRDALMWPYIFIIIT